MIFDTKKEGLLTLFKPYHAVLMEHIWDLNENEGRDHLMRHTNSF